MKEYEQALRIQAAHKAGELRKAGAQKSGAEKGATRKSAAKSAKKK